MMYAGWPFLSRQRIGNLEQLITTNTAYASQIFSNISTSALIVSKILMYIVVAVNVSWWVAAASLLIGAVISFVLKPIFYRTRAIGVEAERTNRTLGHFVGEHVVGMKALKAMALEAPVIAKADALFERMRYLNLRSVILRSYLGTIVQLTGVVFVAVVFVIMYRSANFSIAAFGVIVYAMNQIFSQIQAGQEQLHTVIALTPYIEGSLSYVDESRRNEEAKGGEKSFSIQKGLTFKDVSFSYPERGRVLSHVSFTSKGKPDRHHRPIGCGQDDDCGPLFCASSSLRAARYSQTTRPSMRSPLRRGGPTSAMSQDAVLLNDTLESNISFYDPSVTREGVIKAAKLANVHDFIEGLPQGYDTHIGDRGILLPAANASGWRSRASWRASPNSSCLMRRQARSMRSRSAHPSRDRGAARRHHRPVIAHRMTTVGESGPHSCCRPRDRRGIGNAP